METLSNLFRISYRNAFLKLAFLITFGLSIHSLSARQVEWVADIQGSGNWTICYDNVPVNPPAMLHEASLALACKPNVNVSLGQGGYAVLTALLLVLAPEYPAFLYDVDIMGPLNDTVYCAQLGQSLMVVVTDPTGNSCMSTIFVEDKLKPVLSCTPDVIPCNVDIATLDFELYLDGVSDNCDPDPDLFYSYVILNLPCNANGYTQQINVTWTATDASGNSTTCVDIIYLEKPSLGEIVFPPDVTIDCLNADIDPSNTGEPTFNGEPIGYTCQIVVFHTDQVVPMCNGAQKIIRLWTAMDWCNSGQITDVQEILIIDDVPPVITCPLNITLNTSPGVCTTNYTLPNPPVTDACSDDSLIDIDIFVSTVPGIFSPGTMVNLGLGTSLITIRATDACGNTSQCHYNVTVRDLTPPIPICHSLTIGVGADGMAILIADLLDFPIIENCGILSKQIWRMDNACNAPEDLMPGPDVKFCCADVGDTIMVFFKVTDLSGNMNTCMFQVIVKDQLPPVAECQDITVSISNQGILVITPDQINDGSTDNCLITNITVTPNTFECEDIGVNVVVLTVTDQSGNTATCTATVTITDTVPPVALCQNVTVTVNSDGDAVIITSQINNGSSDNCAIDTMFLNQYEFDCDDEGVNIVQLTVVDFAGNTAACTATVTVLTSPPVALCQDITVSLDAAGMVSIDASQINNGSFDDCGIDTITVSPSTFDCDDIGTNIVTLTVTDISGNVSTCTAVVTVQDNMPPIALCQDITVMLDENGMAEIIAAQINDGSTDNCGIFSITVTPTTFDCDDAGPNVVTLTVTDESNNTSTCTAIVTVMMPDPPEAICQNITVELGPGGIVVITGEQIDNGSSSQCGDVTFEVDPDTFDCDDLGPNIVTLTVTDEAGMSSTCTAIVTVEEAPPVAICQNITVSLNESGMVTITASQVNNNSTDDCGIEELSVTPASFDCTDLGPNIVTLTVTDFSGNTSTCTAIVTVTDITPPVAICQDITVAVNGGSVIITGVQINNGSTDNCSIVSLTVTPDTFDCEDIGPNLVTLTVTDQSGNTSTCTATVTVTSTPPVAICQNITISLDADGVVVISADTIDNGSSASCGELDFSLDEDTFDCDEIGPNIVTLTVTDESGTTATCTATVTVVDEFDPVCSAGDLTVFLDADGNAVISAVMINDGSSDNCGLFTLEVDPTDFTCDDLGPNTVTLTVTDESGNASTCTAIVTVVDTIAPFCSTQDITVSISGSSVTILPADIDDGSSDNCGPVTLEVDPDTFDCDDLGPNVVVLTVTDESGNSSTCTATVTVDDSGSLVANCQNITIQVDANGQVSIDPQDVDNGSGGGCTSGELEFDLTQTDFDCSDLGPNVVTLTVTDETGNTATCTAIITVQDLIPPQITCPPNVTVNCDAVTDPNDTGQFGNATASDNCPGVIITETHVLNLNDCNVGTITRTFTATDASGNIAQCIQVVTVTNPNPFTEADITWPPSPLTVDICNSTNPPATGQPVFDPGSLQCANPMSSFTDQVQTFIDNDPNTVCKIITRTWVVTDACQVNGTFMFVQTINVTDMVPPNFTNINNMTKVANDDCVAFFTVIASATDCAGVTITNNSPYGVNSGSNASGFYPIGSTTVLFTATDGCGNISTMDVVLTVTDPDPTDFMCEKVIIILPEETEITLPAETFVTFIPGNCTDEDNFIVSYSGTDAFDTLRTYDCGDVGVSTFSLWIWTLDGTLIVDSCHTADLDLRDPDDFCMDGFALHGVVENEDNLAVHGVEVKILNVPMTPGMTNAKGEYLIEGLNEGVSYTVAPSNDFKHREGVSTLDLVLIQKHLLGRAKLSSPYKMIAADANKSGQITALDLLDIRKVILGINSRFPNNTSWRFVDMNYHFPDPFNPFNVPFREVIRIDSVVTDIYADFIGIKIGDVNGSFFHTGLSGSKIEQRNSQHFDLITQVMREDDKNAQLIISAASGQGEIDGLQMSLFVGSLTQDQLHQISTDLLSETEWYYDSDEGTLNISWASTESVDITDKSIIGIPAVGLNTDELILKTSFIKPECYRVHDEVAEVRELRLNIREAENSSSEYQLFQNRPNPFKEGTMISFALPKRELIRMTIYDITGKMIYEHSGDYHAGRNDLYIKGEIIPSPGIYYYTLYTSNASLTRKMSFTND